MTARDGVRPTESVIGAVVSLTSGHGNLATAGRLFVRTTGGVGELRLADRVYVGDGRALG